MKSTRPSFHIPSVWRTSLLVGALVLVVASRANAQTVTGAVLDAVSSAPLLGVLVSLIDLDGERVRSVLSDEAGRFVIPVGKFGRFQLRAERIGLQATTSGTFEVFSTQPHFERILMGSRAIEIAGLVVDSRVRQCRTNQREAVQIQRWWQEVRTALDVSSVVQEQGLAQFEVERFEREWDAKLDRIVSNDSRTEVTLSNKPFVSAEAEFLAEGGYVQGELMGQREYYAPDADVLLSGTFLARHCFSVSKSRNEKVLGLSFQPTGEEDFPEIRGTLWVDTTTAELRTLDYSYVNLDDIPRNESGGYVSFEALPSGAWIVRDWYIRMPKLGLRSLRNRDRLALLGYVDVGGRVTPVERARMAQGPPSAVGRVEGIVFDSIRRRGLPDATVSVLGTPFQAQTDSSGAFVLDGVPVGRWDVTFFHDDPRAWGLGASVLPVEVGEDEPAQAYLALPGFREAARIVCLGSGNDAETVLLGQVEDRQQNGLGSLAVLVAWRAKRADGMQVDRTQEVRTGSDGRFVVCTLPGQTFVSVSVRLGDRWVDAFEVLLPENQIVYRRVIIPR
jgi:hypothetical protein